jgi:hypothetical protein
MPPSIPAEPQFAEHGENNMTAIIKKLGMSKEEIEYSENTEGKMKSQLKMRLLEMYNSPVPSDADIHELELATGKLPPEYTSFLKKYNGGIPIPNTIITHDNELVINFFLPIKSPAGYPDSLQSYISKYTNRIPSGMLPIASAGGGDLVLIEKKSGKIYYWKHELEAEGSGLYYFDNVELLSSSIDELMEIFQEID